jgi:poly(A) polymerase
LHPIPTAFTPVIKFLLNGIHIDLLFGRVQDSTKLLQFQQKRPSPLLSSLLADQQALENTVNNSNNNISGDNASSSKPTLSPRLEYSIDDSDFTGTDEAGVRSLNGVRVSQILLEMVPNMEHYAITLRAVKEWATVHGVYSNVLGFLGGVNFAILVAWVCMRHPKERPTSLLRIFFTTFSTWQWPNAVCLTPVQGVPPPGGM